MTSNLPKPPAALLHIHIRKTAGTSIGALLANQFPAARVVTNAHSVRAPSDPGDAQLVTGHVGFDYASRLAEPHGVFTVLRDPVSRALSAYEFYRENDENFFRALQRDLPEPEYLARRRFTQRAKELGMLQFLTHEEGLARMWLANMQTRQLAGGAYLDVADDDPTLLETASANLRRCCLVGLVERMDDTLRLLCHFMRWGDLGPLQHLNRTNRSSKRLPDQRCIDLLRSWNSLDLRLYERAASLMQSKLEAARFDTEGLPDTAMLPEAADFTPDMPIHGFGWHARELHRDKWLCWTAAPAATLYLRLAWNRPRRFRCQLSSVIDQAALDALKITFNATPLSLEKQWTGESWLLQSSIPGSSTTIAPDVARITFDCGAVRRPPPSDNGPRDDRALGVAVSRIWID